MGFKPRSNIFSKLRIKESEAHMDDSLTEADSSLSENILLQSNPGGVDHLSTTVVDDSDVCKGPANFELSSSTPKAVRKARAQKTDNKDEIDLEITEVRDVSTADGPDKDSRDDEFLYNSTSKATGNKQRLKAANSQCTDTSSNDVLLEAFNNTQKICSNLKQELQRQQTENSKLKSQLQDYNIDTEKMYARFADMKQLLKELCDKSNTLSSQKGITDANLEEIKSDCEKLKKKVENYRTEIVELKTALTGLQTLKSNTDSELSNKAKEIDYLKRELNDRSGQLSEEKLRNSTLIREIGKTRDGLREFFTAVLADRHQELENKVDAIKVDVIGKVKDVETLLKRTSGEAERNLTSNISNVSATLSMAIQELSKDSSKALAVQLKEVQGHMLDNINVQICKSQSNLLGDLTKESRSQDVRWEERLGKTQQELQQNLTENNKLVSKGIQGLSESFEHYKNQLDKREDYKSKLTELQSQITSLNLQKGQALTSLGVKEAQYEDLVKQIGLQDSEISKCKDTKNKLRARVDSLAQELSVMKSGWSKLNEENITLKANSENKIIVQGELLKGLQSENEYLKQRNRQLDDARKQFETEHTSHMDKAQRLNDHLQKINVEMVQVKAHELELEEANRKMKIQLEQDKTSYEEATDDFKRLRQRVIVLEGEIQDNVREKVDLQEKNDELRESIKALKQNISNMQRTGAQTEKQEIPNQSKREVRNTGNKCTREEETTATPKEAVKNDSIKVDQVGNNNDEFDLSSSLNDDLELTNPSPIQIKPLKAKKGKSKSMKPPNCSRKKLLLLDEDEPSQLKHRWKKRRT